MANYLRTSKTENLFSSFKKKIVKPKWSRSTGRNGQVAA